MKGTEMGNLIYFIMAMMISIIMTPVIKKIANKFKIISIPKDERRMHNKPIPLMGGIAIYLGFVIALLVSKGFILSNEEMGIIIGATLLQIGGIIDDKYAIKPIYKLMFQISAAMSLVIFGIKINNLTNPFLSYESYLSINWLSIPFTLIWVVGITNAINFIDGLDGLAAGLALISSITIFIIALMNFRNEAALLTAILGGAILGFLPYNFNPASIFMGETGSSLLGFLLAAISMEGAIKSAATFAIVVPILAIGLPIYDTLFAIIRRKINGKPISQADKGHLHHRLIDMGLSQKQAVLIMYLISAVLGGLAIIAMQIGSQRSYFFLATIMLILVLIAWKFGIFKHDK